jgi:hypothetical protein
MHHFLRRANNSKKYRLNEFNELHVPEFFDLAVDEFSHLTTPAVAPGGPP